MNTWEHYADFIETFKFVLESRSERFRSEDIYDNKHAVKDIQLNLNGAPGLIRTWSDCSEQEPPDELNHVKQQGRLALDVQAWVELPVPLLILGLF
jgi:hypothetical protein